MKLSAPVFGWPGTAAELMSTPKWLLARDRLENDPRFLRRDRRAPAPTTGHAPRGLAQDGFDLPVNDQATAARQAGIDDTGYGALFLSPGKSTANPAPACVGCVDRFAIRNLI